MSKIDAYDLPEGPLALDGPIARPAPGTLPLRGDLAHIALAGRYLVPHYVVPQIRTVGQTGASLMISANDDAAVVTPLAAGSLFELLDTAGAWSWGCIGSDGPTGYVLTELLEPAELQK